MSRLRCTQAKGSPIILPLLLTGVKISPPSAEKPVVRR